MGPIYIGFFHFIAMAPIYIGFFHFIAMAPIYIGFFFFFFNCLLSFFLWVYSCTLLPYTFDGWVPILDFYIQGFSSYL